MRTRMTDWITDPEGALSLPIYASSFAKKASGSSRSDDEEDEDDDEDDDEEDADDDSDDDDDEDDDDEDADKSDDELRAELAATRAALKKANGSSARKRKALRSKEAELEAERKKRSAPAGKKDDAAAQAAIDEAKAEGRREAQTEADNRYKRAEAKSALIAAGLTRDGAADIVSLIKLDELDLDGDEVDGLDEEIARVKKAHPALFPKRGTRSRRSVTGKGDRDGRDAPKKKLTASEAQAALLTGRG